MRTYHPIQFVESIQWHNAFTDRRLWAGVAIVGFITLFTILVIYSANGNGTSAMPYYNYYGMWPYGPPYVPIAPH